MDCTVTLFTTYGCVPIPRAPGGYFFVAPANRENRIALFPRKTFLAFASNELYSRGYAPEDQGFLGDWGPNKAAEVIEGLTNGPLKPIAPTEWCRDHIIGGHKRCKALLHLEAPAVPLELSPTELRSIEGRGFRALASIQGREYPGLAKGHVEAFRTGLTPLQAWEKGNAGKAETSEDVRSCIDDYLFLARAQVQGFILRQVLLAERLGYAVPVNPYDRKVSQSLTRFARSLDQWKRASLPNLCPQVPPDPFRYQYLQKAGCE
jgi:hypothetical protein